MTTACRDVVGQVVSYEERFCGGAKSRRMPENGAAEGARSCWFLSVAELLRDIELPANIESLLNGI